MFTEVNSTICSAISIIVYGKTPTLMVVPVLNPLVGTTDLVICVTLSAECVVTC